MNVTIRAVIVNADDFGQSAGINHGIVDAHERGVVTSASLMVRGVAARGAAAYARAHPNLSIGLHVDLGEWWCRGGEWIRLYERAVRGDPVAVAAEIGEQVERFRDLLGRNPTHLDSHQHAHRLDPARTILLELAAALGVPLRECSAGVRYDGRFYGQSATGATIPDALTGTYLAHLLRRLPPGITELGCHPGYAGSVSTMYCDERAAEVEALCSPEVRRVFDETDLRLMSFEELSHPVRDRC